MRNSNIRSPIPIAKKGLTRRKIERRNKIITISAIIVALAIGIAISLRANAYEISANGIVLGRVKDKDIPNKSLEIIVAGLKEKYKSDVKVVTSLDVKPVFTSKKKLITPDYLITQMKQNMDYEIQMIELNLDGESVGIFASEDSAKELIERIKETYIPAKVTEVKEINLLADIELKPVYVKEDALSDPDKLYKELTKTTEEQRVYNVQSGDTLWGIADRHHMTVSELMDENPTITDKTPLQIGQGINVKVDKPVVSVEVVEEYQKGETLVQNIYVDGLLQ